MWQKFLYIMGFGILLIFLGVVALRLIVQYGYLNPRIQTEPLNKEAVASPGKKNGKPTHVHLHDLSFRFTREITVYTKDLLALGYPVEPFDRINFDYMQSLRLHLKDGKILVPTETLNYVFNNRIFAYPESPLKDLRLKVFDNKRVRLTGQVDLMSWLDFVLTAKLELNKNENTILVKTQSLKVLGAPFVKNLMDVVFLDLEKLVFPIDRERGSVIRGNDIVVWPFKLFPPPYLKGQIDRITSSKRGIILHFEDANYEKRPKLATRAGNYLQVRYGDIQFGRLQMQNAQLQLVDSSADDPFDFYLDEYKKALQQGFAKIKPWGPVIAYLPDHEDLK